MYELERKPDDYQDVSTACASASIDVIATDIDVKGLESLRASAG